MQLLTFCHIVDLFERTLRRTNDTPISDSTKNVLDRLDDVVTINAYYSREPAQVAERRRKVRDVLDEYRAFSNRLQINFIDPAGFDEGEKQELRFRGINELQVNVIQKDKAEVANGLHERRRGLRR